MAGSCLCGSIRVLFALLKWPDLVKACLTSKCFGLEYISFILRGSCMMSELARHHHMRTTQTENKHRAVMACESSGVCGYRRVEQGDFQCSPLLPVPWKCEEIILLEYKQVRNEAEKNYGKAGEITRKKVEAERDPKQEGRT